jgi:hypothetical protein
MGKKLLAERENSTVERVATVLSKFLGMLATDIRISQHMLYYKSPPLGLPVDYEGNVPVSKLCCSSVRPRVTVFDLYVAAAATAALDEDCYRMGLNGSGLAVQLRLDLLIDRTYQKPHYGVKCNFHLKEKTIIANLLQLKDISRIATPVVNRI